MVRGKMIGSIGELHALEKTCIGPLQPFCKPISAPLYKTPNWKGGSAIKDNYVVKWNHDPSLYTNGHKY